MRTLDSHLHVWDPQRFRYGWLSGELDAGWGPTEWRAAHADAPPGASVFVQADCAASDARAEVAWAASLATKLDLVAVVGWAPVEDPSATEALLAAYADVPLVSGVRRILQGEPDDLPARTSFRDGCRVVAARGLTFDACVSASQLPQVAALADAVPELPLVLDHLGKPPVGHLASPARPADSDWPVHLRELARRPSVLCKLSGLPAEATGDWDATLFEPFLDEALGAFGPARLMFGSDWPVSVRRRGDPQHWGSLVERWALDRLGEAGAAEVMWGNGMRFYAPSPTV